MSVVTIGLDLAKSVFQVHGVDAAAHTVLRRDPTPGENAVCVIRLDNQRPTQACRGLSVPTTSTAYNPPPGRPPCPQTRRIRLRRHP